MNSPSCIPVREKGLQLEACVKAGVFVTLNMCYQHAHSVFSNPHILMALSEILRTLTHALCSNTTTSHWVWLSRVRSSTPALEMCCLKGSWSTCTGWDRVLTLFLCKKKKLNKNFCIVPCKSWTQEINGYLEEHFGTLTAGPIPELCTVAFLVTCCTVTPT